MPKEPQFKNDQYYMVLDYSDPEGSEPKYKMVYGDKIFEILSKAKDNDQKIAIYTLGECVIDWS